MRFNIYGANSETGDDVQLVVEAPDEEAAQEQASRKGILVSTCQPADRTGGSDPGRYQKPTLPTEMANSVGPRQCGNCNREMGKLEKLFPWEGHGVCLMCFQQLKMEAEICGQSADATAANISPSAPAQPHTPASGFLAGLRGDTSTGSPAATATAPDRGEQLASARRQALFQVIVSGLFSVLLTPVAVVASFLGPETVGLLCVWGLAVFFIGTAAFRWRSYQSQMRAAGNNVSVRADLAALGKRAARNSALIVGFLIVSPLFIAAVTWTSAWLVRLIGLGDGVAGIIAVAMMLVSAFLCIGAAFELDRSRCPSCGNFLVALVMRTEHLGTQEQYQTNMQNVQVRDGMNPAGPVIANYNVPVQERYVTTHWREYCRCKKCGHEWHRDVRNRRKG